MHNFGHKIVPEGLNDNFGQNAPAQNDLICSQNGQNCTHTRVCALNVALPDPEGVRYQPPKGLVYEPGSRRLTVRYEKKKLPLTPTPSGSGMNTPMGCSYMFRGTPKGSPLNIPGPKVPVKKKKGLRSNYKLCFWPKVTFNINKVSG